MVIRVSKLVQGCDTNDDGVIVNRAIVVGLKSPHMVTLDFSGIHNATSSFVNSAFVALLQDFSLAEIRTRLKIVGANRQIASLIRDRMRIEGSRAREAA